MGGDFEKFPNKQKEKSKQKPENRKSKYASEQKNKKTENFGIIDLIIVSEYCIQRCIFTNDQYFFIISRQTWLLST